MKLFQVKHFLFRLSVFILAAWLFLSAADILYASLAASSGYSSIRYWSYLMKERIDADCIALGSSRCLNHIVPSMLDSALGLRTYNLGMSRAHIAEDYARYQLYCTKHQTPRLVLLVLEPATIHAISPRTEYYQYYPWFHDRDFRRIVFPLIHFSFADRILPLYRFRGYGLGDLFRHSEPLESGFWGLDHSFDPDLINDFSTEFYVDSQAEILFFDFLDTLDKDGVRVMFVFSPVYHAAGTEEIEEKDMGEMLAYFRRIAAERSIPVCDLHEMPFSGNPSYFVNHVHLNRKGAVAFTDSLITEMKTRCL